MKSNKQTQRLLCTALSAVLTAILVFGALYWWGNKYTAPGVQPIGGVLVLTEEELTAVPVHYLIREWECYPDRLLTPADFANSTPNLYRQYLSVGQYGGMELGRRDHSPHGSASYRLTLELPPTPRQYALALPVIYSAYHLYLNDSLAPEMGNPDPDRYRPALQNRVFTFEAGGRVQLLIAATDQSWIYSGMVYPPAFGTFESVFRLETQSLLLRAIFPGIAAFVLLLSIYTVARTKWRYGNIFALTALCFIGYTAAPLVHSLTASGGRLLNCVFLFCFYAMLGLAVTVQCVLCGVPRKIKSVAVAFSLFGAFVALGIGLGAPSLPLNALLVFSVVSGLWKLGAAVGLLLSAAYGIYEKKPMAEALLWVAVFFAISLPMDRLLPLYEPIYSGWFLEIASAVLLGGLTFVFWKTLADAYRDRLSYDEYMRRITRQLEMQKLQYRQLTEQVQQVRVARHDLRQHMRLLGGLAEKGDLGGIRTYLGAYRPPIGGTAIESFTGHTADAVLSHYAYRAKAQAVYFDAKVSLPEEIAFPDEELCILLGNLLENAVDAASMAASGHRKIFLRCEAADGKLRLVLDNSFDPAVKKAQGEGLGLTSVRAVVERHGGLMSVSAQDHLFKVSILMNLDA